MANSQTDLRCGLCNRIYKNRKLFIKHLQSHDKPAVFNCPQCGKTFPTRNRLERHVRIHSGERPHKCSKCLTSFATAFQLKLHERRHTGEKPHSCTMCQKSFTSSSGLQRHKITHTKETSFICTQCCKGFSQMEKLKQHERIHTGERPFMCDRCPKTFRTKNTLVRHLRIHSGETYKCLHCPKAFGELYALKKHHKSRHRDIPFLGPAETESHAQQECKDQSDEMNSSQEENVAKSCKEKGRLRHQSKIKQRQLKTEMTIQKLEQLTQIQREDKVDELQISIGEQSSSTILDENGWHRITLPAASDLMYKNMEHASGSENTNVQIIETISNKNEMNSENAEWNTNGTPCQSIKKVHHFAKPVGMSVKYTGSGVSHDIENSGTCLQVSHVTDQEHSLGSGSTHTMKDCSSIPDTRDIQKDDISDRINPISLCSNEPNAWDGRESLSHPSIINDPKRDPANRPSFPVESKFDDRSEPNAVSNHHDISEDSHTELYHFHPVDSHGEGNNFSHSDYQPIYHDLSSLEETNMGSNKQNRFQGNVSVNVSTDLYQPGSHNTFSHLDGDTNTFSNHQDTARDHHQSQQICGQQINSNSLSHHTSHIQICEDIHAMDRNSLVDDVKIKSSCGASELESHMHSLDMLRRDGLVTKPNHQPKLQRKTLEQFQNMSHQVKHSLEHVTHASIRHGSVLLPASQNPQFISCSGQPPNVHLCQPHQLHPLQPPHNNHCQPSCTDLIQPCTNEFQVYSHNSQQPSPPQDCVLVNQHRQSFYPQPEFPFNTHSTSCMRECSSIPFSTHSKANQIESTREKNPGLTVSLGCSSSNPDKQNTHLASPNQRSLSGVCQASVSSVESDQLSPEMSWHFNPPMSSVPHFDSLTYQNSDNEHLQQHPVFPDSNPQMSPLVEMKRNSCALQQPSKEHERTLSFAAVYRTGEKSATIETHKVQNSEVNGLTSWGNPRYDHCFGPNNVVAENTRKLTEDRDGICHRENCYDLNTDKSGRVECDRKMCKCARLDPLAADFDINVSGTEETRIIGIDKIRPSCGHSEAWATKTDHTGEWQNTPEQESSKPMARNSSPSLDNNKDRKTENKIDVNNQKCLSSVHREIIEESKIENYKMAETLPGINSGNQQTKCKKNRKCQRREPNLVRNRSKICSSQQIVVNPQIETQVLSGTHSTWTSKEPGSEQMPKLSFANDKNSSSEILPLTKNRLDFEDLDERDRDCVGKKKRKFDGKGDVINISHCKRKKKHSFSQVSENEQNRGSDIKNIELSTKSLSVLRKQNIKSQTALSEPTILDFMEIHCKVDPDKNDWECLKCDKKYKSVRYLRNHVLSKHLDAVKPQCHICQKTFPNPSQLKRHVKTHSTIKEFPCGKCSKAFTAKKYLANHMKRHNRPTQPFICEECGKTFPRRQQLYIHCRTHSGEKPYTCSHCAKKFATSFQVKLHERIHTGVRPYLCPHCNKHFKTNSNLVVHIRRHRNQRPYLCATCGSAFYESSKLKAHVRVHTGALPFTCKQCWKSFRVKHQLVQHMRWHTDKTFNCEFCPKAFDERWILRRHVKKQHPGHPVPYL